MPDEEIIYRFQLSRVLPAGTDTASMIALNRTLYERARDMGGYRMTSSAVEMSQDDWKRHYGPAWQIVQAAKTKFDPKNVLTPGHGMFPSLELNALARHNRRLSRRFAILYARVRARQTEATHCVVALEFFGSCSGMSIFGGKADMTIALRNAR